jgi:nucleoside-triphosphatase THEP1
MIMVDYNALEKIQILEEIMTQNARNITTLATDSHRRLDAQDARTNRVNARCTDLEADNKVLAEALSTIVASSHLMIDRIEVLEETVRQNSSNICSLADDSHKRLIAGETIARNMAERINLLEAKLSDTMAAVHCSIVTVSELDESQRRETIKLGERQTRFNQRLEKFEAFAAKLSKWVTSV